MPVRMKDIARDCGVAVVTVSKVLRGHADIGEETRSRILKRVQELDYHPNWAARTLATGRTYTIGFIVPDLTHPFFSQIAKGIVHQIRPKNYSLLITSSEEDPQLEVEEIDTMLQRQIDALIVASVQISSVSGVFARLEGRNVPYVMVDRAVPGLKANYVGADDERIGEIAAEHLIAQGYQRIAHIRGPEISTAIGRLRGFKRTLERNGLEVPPEYIVFAGAPDDRGDETGYEAMQQLLQLESRPDAVFCYNDPVAAGALRAVLQTGLRVPEDLGLIGSANLRYSDILRVPLSSIDQSAEVIGEHAARLVLKLLQSKNRATPRRILIPSTLVIRESSNRVGRGEHAEAGMDQNH